MNEARVVVQGISKRFHASWAVRDVSFSLQSSQVTGFIGANGAGKTTTMRILATLETPEEGEVFLDGLNAFQYAKRVRPLIGWMADVHGWYDNTTVYEYLDFFARAYRIPRRQKESRLEEIIHFTEITPLLGQEMKTVSKGQAQRVALARTLVHDPEILILDEPAAGLDPKARVEFKHLIRLLAEEGKTIFISSHILSELEDMCDSLLFIDQGKVVHHGKAEELKKGGEGKLIFDVRACCPASTLEQALLLQPGITILEAIRDGYRVETQTFTSAQRALFIRRLIDEGIPVFEFHERQRKLEDAFIDIVSKLSGGDHPR
jgi:ABC-2 type transport system ATP-binding protein